MRVVGGEFRSRKLDRPPAGVRPTSDRVREALFSKLGDVNGMRVLDLFAGTGALAIEALSRGAAEAVLVDVAAASLTVVRKNLASLGLEDRARAIRGDAVRILGGELRGQAFDLVLVDPPYGSDRLTPVLDQLTEGGVLDPNATVVVETAKRHALAPVAGLVIKDERSYGDTRLTWLVPMREAEHPERG